jgi:hypothetical protein
MEDHVVDQLDLAARCSCQPPVRAVARTLGRLSGVKLA